MSEDVEILRQHVESLGLDQKPNIEQEDLNALWLSLDSSDEMTLAKYVKGLKSPKELKDLIVNTLYG